MDFFLPAWAFNSIFACIGIVYLILLFYIISAKHLSLSEKLLNLIAIFALPVLGAVLAIYYVYSRKNRTEVYGKTLP